MTDLGGWSIKETDTGFPPRRWRPTLDTWAPDGRWASNTLNSWGTTAPPSVRWSSSRTKIFLEAWLSPVQNQFGLVFETSDCGKAACFCMSAAHRGRTGDHRLYSTGKINCKPLMHQYFCQHWGDFRAEGEFGNVGPDKLVLARKKKAFFEPTLPSTTV